MTDRERLAALVDEVVRSSPPQTTPDQEFRGRRFDAGLAFVSYRAGHGGLGLDPGLQSFVEQRFLDSGASDSRMRNVIGLGMAAPTIHEHGTADQLALLRPLYTGEHVWCQLFSEPGAGSDLAGLATRAQDRGDHYLVNGQKVWTSLGHVARWGLLLARTDPDVPKHHGLSYFILDMTAPGVEVRGLRQMTGESEFNEVYLTDVVVPKSQVIGEPGQGWRIAMTTLMNERIAAGGSPLRRGEGPISQAMEAYAAAVHEGRPDAVTALGGGHPGKAYLRSMANSIEGGTSEILRNTLGERVLGLPPEPRADRDIAWTRTRRS